MQIYADIQIILAPEQNGHWQDDSMVDKARFRETMRSPVIEDPAPPVKRAYDAAVANAHRQGSGDRPALDSFHTFRRMLNRTKASLLPEIPHMIDDVVIDGTLAETCLNDRYLLHTTILGEYLDATFRCYPSPYMQFVTILGKYGFYRWHWHSWRVDKPSTTAKYWQCLLERCGELAIIGGSEYGISRSIVMMTRAVSVGR